MVIGYMKEDGSCPRELYISNTHLKYRACVMSWASGWNWIILQEESDEQSIDIFMWENVIYSSFKQNFCMCINVLMQPCLHIHVIALGMCVCSYMWVISGLSVSLFWSWGSLLSVFNSHTADSPPCFCFASLCYKLTYLSKVVTNRLKGYKSSWRKTQGARGQGNSPKQW